MVFGSGVKLAGILLECLGKVQTEAQWDVHITKICDSGLVTPRSLGKLEEMLEGGSLVMNWQPIQGGKWCYS